MSFHLLLSSAIWTLVRKLGAFAFIPLGIADNSFVPLPGSMDALLIVLAASRRELWWYYALWATIGSVVGGFVFYHFAAKGGKDAIEKKLGKERSEKAFAMFERWGFGAVVLGALAPPPVPILPFLGTAGALAYARHKFLIALALGRAVRFALVGWVAAHYGRHIFSFFTKYYKPAMWTLIALAVVGGFVALFYYLRHKRRKREERQAGAAVPEHKAA